MFTMLISQSQILIILLIINTWLFEGEFASIFWYLAVKSLFIPSSTRTLYTYLIAYSFFSSVYFFSLGQINSLACSLNFSLSIYYIE